MSEKNLFDFPIDLAVNIVNGNSTVGRHAFMLSLTRKAMPFSFRVRADAVPGIKKRVECSRMAITEQCLYVTATPQGELVRTGLSDSFNPNSAK